MPAVSLELGRPKTRVIAFLAARDTQVLDVTGPFQIFVRAADLLAQRAGSGPRPYEVLLLSTGPGPVQTNCGLVLGEAIPYYRLRKPVDTLLVAGGTGLEAAESNQKLLSWLRKNTARARRYGSICTGAFLLAAAGVLDGKRVTTHWKWADDLAHKCRRTTVDSDAIYIRDGRLYTSAGITAGMDLALALVEEDLGAAIALEVAREMVMFLRRSGGQSQFSRVLALQASDRHQIEELHAWVAENLAADLRVDALAEKARMSPRNFARVFTRETGMRPGEFVQKVRIEAARRRLEESSDKVEKIAEDCGFGSINSIRRSFLRHLHVVPSDYRRRFAAKQ